MWARDSLKAVPLLLLLLLGLRREARAYVDPGTGALIWQSLAAAFVAVLFYCRRFANRLRRNKQETEE